MVKNFTHSVVMEIPGHSVVIADCANVLIADAVLKTMLENVDPYWSIQEISSTEYRTFSGNEHKIDFRIIPYQR